MTENIDTFDIRKHKNTKTQPKLPLAYLVEVRDCKTLDVAIARLDRGTERLELWRELSHQELLEVDASRRGKVMMGCKHKRQRTSQGQCLQARVI
jgi:hypothetical protein